MRPAGGLLPQHSEMKSRALDQAADARMRRGGARRISPSCRIGKHRFDVDQISPDPDVYKCNYLENIGLFDET